MDRLIVCALFEDDVESGYVTLSTIGIYKEETPEIKNKIYDFISDKERTEISKVYKDIFIEKIKSLKMSELFEDNDIVNKEVQIKTPFKYIFIDIYSIPLDKLPEFRYSRFGGN